MKSVEVVGHVPRFLSCILRRGGSVTCRMSGYRQYSNNLPQGELVKSLYVPVCRWVWLNSRFYFREYYVIREIRENLVPRKLRRVRYIINCNEIQGTDCVTIMKPVNTLLG